MGSRGQPIAYLMSVADISAQKRAEHAMRALFSRLVDRQEKDLTGDLMQQAVKKNVEQGVQNLINDLLKKNE
jgi:cytochrome c553